jgi:tetratricopeptide (TPR) repeat protein
VRAGRGRCPRCRAKLAAPDPARAAAFSRRLRHAAAGLGGVFVLSLITLWFLRAPAPADTPGSPADPFADRRLVPVTLEEPVIPAADDAGARAGKEPPFLDPAGAGAIAYAAGDYEAALAKFQEAIERNPRDAEALSNLGQVLVRLNRAAEALPFFERAIAEIPDRWAYRFNLARAHASLKQWPDAIASYRRAQQLFPDDYATAFNLAQTLHKSGDDAGAVEAYQKAIALEPNDPTFRMALGMSYERLKKKSEAAAAYHEALRLAPEAPDADKVRAKIVQLTQAAPAG